MAGELSVRNHSTSTQTRWVNFVVPRGHTLAGSAYLDAGNGRIAARQDSNFDSNRDPTGGDWIYSVRDTWAAAANSEVGNVTLADLSALSGNPGWSFTLGSYYGSTVCGQNTYNPNRFPIVKIATGNSWTAFREQIDLRGITPTVIYSGNRYRCLEVVKHQGGFHVHFWLHLWHDQDLAEWSLSVTWSDETVQDTWFLPCKGIVVDFNNTNVKSKWGHLEQWETTGGTRWLEGTTGSTFRLPFTFDNGPPAPNDWGQWGDTFVHGFDIHFRGWMGRASDLSAVHHLSGHCSPTVWNTHYMASGKVPPVPVVSGNNAPPPNTNRGFSTPATSKTWTSGSSLTGEWHYVTLDRGAGGPEPGIGLHMNSYPASQGGQGGFGFINGGQVLHGYQPLIHFEQAYKDWGRRPRYIRRDGTPVTWEWSANQNGPIGDENMGLVLQRQHPHTGAQTGGQKLWLLGRNRNTAGTFGGVYKRVQNSASNTATRMAQSGIDPQHMTGSTLTAYYQMTLDPAAYKLIRDLCYTERLSGRIHGSAGGSKISGDREPGRWVNTFAQIYKVLPIGDEVADVCADMLDVGRTKPDTSGNGGTATMAKRNIFRNSFNYRNPTAAQRWNKEPITVGNNLVCDGGTLTFDATAKEIYRTDAFWDSNPTAFVKVEDSGANNKQFRVSRRIVGSGKACTVTGGDTITLDSGTWTNTPNVGRGVKITRSGSPGGYTHEDIIAAGSNTTTVVLTNGGITNESATFTVEEATLDVNDSYTIKWDNTFGRTTIKTMPNVTTLSSGANRTIYSMGDKFGTSDARLIQIPYPRGTCGYVGPMWEVIGAAGLYVGYLATGETEWRDLAFAILTNAVNEGTLICPHASGDEEWCSYTMLAEQNGLANPRPDLRNGNNPDAAHFAADGGVSLRRWSSGGIYLAATYHTTGSTKQKATSMLTHYKGGSLWPGWMFSSFVAAVDSA